MLSKEAVEQFKKIYFEEFGEKLIDQSAMEKAMKLLLLFRVIYKPIEKYEKPATTKT